MDKNELPALRNKFNQEKKQQDLRQEYGIKKKDIVVVEKKSKTVGVAKEIFKFIKWLFAILFKIVVIALVAVALITLIFPEPRNALLAVLIQSFNEVKQFIVIGI